jgi:hypothetical protein
MNGQVLDIRIVTDHFMRIQKIYKYKYEVLPDQPDAGMIDLAFSELCLRAAHAGLGATNNRQPVEQGK